MWNLLEPIPTSIRMFFPHGKGLIETITAALMGIGMGIGTTFMRKFRVGRNLFVGNFCLTKAVGCPT